MKKYLIFMCAAVLLSTSVQAASCAGGSGKVVYGNDKVDSTGAEKDPTEYCQSSISMNWWSAFAWCDSIGMQLIDLTKECIKSEGSDPCPNLAGVGSGSVWTQNVPSADHAYYVTLSSGAVNDGSYGRDNYYYYAALCVAPQAFY